MENVTITDLDGCTMVMKSFNGLLLPLAASDQAMTDLQHLQARDDDVIVCGYPKCGTNWVLEVTSMLLTGSTNYSSSKFKIGQMLEFTSGDMFHQIPSPRLFNTHLPYDMLPEDFKLKKCRLVYTLRNPKDVAVSLYNHMANGPNSDYHGTWKEFLTIFLDGRVFYGNYFDYLKNWNNVIGSEKDVTILPIYYENFKQDFKNGAKKLCEFLQITRSDAFIESVAEACAFDKMKMEKETIPGAPLNNFRAGTSFFRKGVVGDWRFWFTVAQNERFDQAIQEKMEELNLQFKYKLAEA